MNNIVIIDHEPLSIRRQRIFGIEELIQVGFNVEHWDMSSFFYPGMQIVDTLQTDYSIQLSSLDALQARLQTIDIPQTLFIVEAFDRWPNRCFFRLLSDNGCYMIRLELYATATLDELPLWHKILVSTPKQAVGGIWHLIQQYRYEHYKRAHRINGYNLSIRSGRKQPADVYINHPDWEAYQQARQTIPAKPSGHKYVVFLDEFFPLHPDCQYFLKQAPGNAKVYHDSLNRFFDRLEEQYGAKVIIAAHPKATYVSETFGEREIVKYRTVELVRDAEWVIMHSSAAFSFAVMFDKPLMLITTDGYTRTRTQYRHLLRLSRLTGLAPINIDRSNPETWIPHQIPKEVRNRYIYDYLTSPGIENQNTIDILTDLFRSL